jgi:hypothetical protein
MVDVAADDVAPDRMRLSVARAWRMLAILALLGLVSFTVVSDQSSSDRGNCEPFTLGVSPLGGCDWLE